MEESDALKSMPQCRLCGIFGNLRMDIFGRNARPGSSSQSVLSEKILRCVDIQVERNDETTKICGNCFCNVYEYARFRDICAATNTQMRKPNHTKSGASADAVPEFNRSRAADTDGASSSSGINLRNPSSLSDTHIECISLSDDETEPEIDEPNAERKGTGKNRHQTEEAVLLNSENAAALNGRHISIDSPVALVEGTADVDGETDGFGVQDVGAHNKKRKRLMRETVETMSVFSVKCRFRGRCTESFESWHAMMRHMKTYHAKGVKKTFECHLCKKTSTTKQSLQWHMNSLHTHNTRFMCPIRACSKIFTLKFSLKRHTDAVHIKKLAFKCSKCPMKFNSKQELTRHLANKHGQGITFTCYLCKSSFGFKQSLKRHMDSFHTYQPRFKCPFPLCSKSFARKGTLTVHTNAVHTKKTAFKCTECGRVFYQKGSLNRHLANKH